MEVSETKKRFNEIRNKATQFLILQEMTNSRLRTLVESSLGAHIIYLFDAC